MSAVKRVPPTEAARLVAEEGYHLVDVRTVVEFDAGHPAGSDNVPFMIASATGTMVENPEFFEIFEALYAKDKKLVLSCRSGVRSLRAATALSQRGYLTVLDQQAGFEGPRNPFGKVIEPGWASLGLPVESVTAGASYAELKQRLGKP